MQPQIAHDPAAPLARFESLFVRLPPGGDRPYAVEDVSYEIAPGEIVCVVGESGSGKSISAAALMGLLPRELKVSSGRAFFRGEDVATLTPARQRALRGRDIAMIFQEPLSALNPVMRIGAQIQEMFDAHGVLPGAQGRARILELLGYVGLPDVERLIDAYPFQLSGGQRQRVVIAMAIALEPALILADEPTTALDVTTQAQVLDLLRKIRRERGAGMLFVTHDFGVVADIADRVVVMEKGRIVEQGPARQVLLAPAHPYTQRLIAAVPRLAAGDPPPPQDDVALKVEGLSKTFGGAGGWFSKARVVKAADRIDLEVRRGETVGVIGESGSGKSTLGRMIVRLIEPDCGRVLLDGVDLAHLSSADLRRERRRVQMVFQDPQSSLNPRKRVREILTDGPLAHGVPRAEAEARAAELLELVGLGAAALTRFPHEFSGGQRQRVGIARALMMRPDLIIADEAVSALDVSVQAQVLDLFAELQRAMRLSMIFVTHDLRVAARLCHRVLVMRRGEVVEQGPTRRVFEAPAHPYTQELLAAIPGRHFDERPQ